MAPQPSFHDKSEIRQADFTCSLRAELFRGDPCCEPPRSIVQRAEASTYFGSEEEREGYSDFSKGLSSAQEDGDAPSRKRLVSDKDAPSRSAEKKKRRVESSKTAKDGEPSRERAAVRVDTHFSSSSRVGFLSADTISQPKAYGEMSSQGSRFVEFINKMVIEYEEKACKDSSKLGDKEKKVADLNEKLLAATSKSESELENAIETLALKHEAKMDLSVTKVVRFEKENAALQKDLELKSDLLSAAERRKGKLKIDKDRLALMAVVAAKDKEVELSQMDANLELIVLLKGAEPPSLDSEVDKINGYKVGLDDVYGKHDGIVAGLVSELGLLPLTPTPSPSALNVATETVIGSSPIAPESKIQEVSGLSFVACELETVVVADPKPAFDAEPVEKIAVSVGFLDQHGTDIEARDDGDAELKALLVASPSIFCLYLQSLFLFDLVPGRLYTLWRCFVSFWTNCVDGFIRF
ncbi:unnamed protein product [Microthlaspi erraticum]|uniref:Uncharacterized protein n=1 Tax=Microthlaspi erraticum TaxID=1685480 RepID=A0A6D2IRF8_9BRAS|nr:unnamed protein product [Microthlaspi erraticum]